jgi:hypothetical protein
MADEEHRGRGPIWIGAILIALLIAFGASFLLNWRGPIADHRQQNAFADNDSTPAPTTNQVLPSNVPEKTKLPVPTPQPAPLESELLPNELAFVSPRGTAVADLRVFVESQAGKLELVTNASGVAVLPGEHQTGIIVELPDGTHFFNDWREGLVSERQLPNVRDGSIPSQFRRITVYSPLTYSLDIRYEDGATWEGELSMTVPTKMTPQTIQVIAGRLDGLIVPDGVEAYVCAFSRRGGFDSKAEQWIGGDRDPSRSIELILPRDTETTLALIMIDLSSFGSAKVTITCSDLRPMNGTPVLTQLSCQHTNGGRVHIIGHHRAGNYNVSAMTQDLGWDSGIFHLAEQETCLLQPIVEPCGTVSCKVFDAEGNPLPDARVSVSRGRFPQWDIWKTDLPGWCEVGVRCRADEFGQCTLYGIPPGQLEVEVNARGFELVVIPCNIAAGNLLDLGEVRLLQATGSIQMQLTGVKADAKYEAVLYQTGSSPVDDAVSFDDSGYLDLQRVQLRTYTIVVRQCGGGWATSKFVELSADNPTVRLDFEVRQK